MNGELAQWFTHSLTLSLATFLLLLVLAVIEVLLRGLAAIGNVRFQGLLDDNQDIFPIGEEAMLHLSSLLAVLRWLQIAAVGLLWFTLSRITELLPAVTVGLMVGLPLLVALSAHRIARGLGEKAIAMLLRALRPFTLPLVRLMIRFAPGPHSNNHEDEEEEASDREIQAFLDVGQAAGIIEADEGEFLESLVEFFDTTVREVMTPRTEMVALPETASHEELLEAFASSRKSRIPVYRETVDKVVGVVHVKSLVRGMLSGERASVSELANPCLEVPEGKELGALLRDFQHGHLQMAIVVDEYGGTSGLVTLEDILEEIVGEIQDEHDPKQEPEVQEMEPGVYRLQGRAPLEVLDDLMGVPFEEDDVDTVGGLVFSRHGTVPEPGTVVVDEATGLSFTVEEMQERRIASVTVRRDGEEDAQKESDDKA